MFRRWTALDEARVLRRPTAGGGSLAVALAVLSLGALAAKTPLAAPPPAQPQTLGAAVSAVPVHGLTAPGVLEHEEKSPFSYIRVRRDGNLRYLCFVRDNGEEAVQTVLNIRKPHELVSAYTRAMFSSYLLRPKQQQVLIVGLGGGAMVHFLRHHDPKLHIDVVELDPVVVRIAEKFFSVRGGQGLEIITADAFDYLAKAQKKYDVIYMDAFLKPTQQTDVTGVPLRIKGVQFYKDVQKKLAPEGLVVWNINVHPGLKQDLQTISEAFPQAYLLRTEAANVVAIGSLSAQRPSGAVLRSRAQQLDRRFKTNFSFADWAVQLAQ